MTNLKQYCWKEICLEKGDYITSQDYIPSWIKLLHVRFTESAEASAEFAGSDITADSEQCAVTSAVNAGSITTLYMPKINHC